MTKRRGFGTNVTSSAKGSCEPLPFSGGGVAGADMEVGEEEVAGLPPGLKVAAIGFIPSRDVTSTVIARVSGAKKCV